MKTIYYKIICFVFLIPTLGMGNISEKMNGKYTKEKSVNKEFSVDKDALMKINNSYGNIDITSWTGNKIVMEVTIKVNGNDEERVLEKLKDIDVEFEASSKLVSARTIFDSDSGSWWTKFTSGWNNSSLHMEINYVVKVPITNRIDLNNDYGSITLDKIKGQAKINCDYGQIIVGELLADQNYINIDYTNNSTISYMKGGEIIADYSDFDLVKGENITLNADYTQSKFGAIKSLNYNCDYGGLKINKVESIKGNGDYLSMKIENISKDANLSASYGSISIKELEPSVKSIILKTDYVGVAVGYSPSLNFDFLVKASYGSIKVGDDITIEKKHQENSGKHYQGYKGEKNSGSSINIHSSYGGVKLMNR